MVSAALWWQVEPWHSLSLTYQCIHKNCLGQIGERLCAARCCFICFLKPGLLFIWAISDGRKFHALRALYSTVRFLEFVPDLGTKITFLSFHLNSIKSFSLSPEFYFDRLFTKLYRFLIVLMLLLIIMSWCLWPHHFMLFGKTPDAVRSLFYQQTSTKAMQRGKSEGRSFSDQRYIEYEISSWSISFLPIYQCWSQMIKVKQWTKNGPFSEGDIFRRA